MTEDPHRETIQEMLRRVDGFEQTLRAHSSAATAGTNVASSSREIVPAAAAMAAPCTPVVMEGLQRSASAEALRLETPEKRGPPELPANVEAVVKRMRNKAMLPQQIFLQQVEQYKVLDPAVWNQHFPDHFRERIAPEFLAEVYSSGMTGEQYGRGFLRDRDLLECQPAREIIAGLAAIDTMMMVDEEEGLLNKVSTEKLARKVLALMRAYEPCVSLACWSRPKGKEGDKWKSKVDWAAARRIDPFFKQSETLIRIPGLEDELKRSMDQEATFLRVAQRLEDAATGRPG